MSYLEELLPELRKGTKIRRRCWKDSWYIYYDNEKNGIFDQDGKCDVLCSWFIMDCEWEFYTEPKEEYDWQYIIDHKCLCWFWNGDDRNKGIIDYLVAISHESYDLYENTAGCRWSHCRPVRKDEITFYEDQK